MLEQVKQVFYSFKRGDSEHHAIAHVMPLWLLFAVFGGLLILTIITVTVTYIDLGKFNLWLALIIAGIKAMLVALYFMHLRYDRPFNGFIFLTALVFVVLMVGIVLMDSGAYQLEMIPGYEPAMEQRQ